MQNVVRAFHSVLAGLALSAWACVASAGSVDLVRDINTTVTPFNSEPTWLGAIGPRAIFTATISYGVSGTGLYASEGTEGGTERIFTPTVQSGGESPRTPYVLDAQLLFFASNSSAGQVELWRTDGTVDGTARILATKDMDFVAWFGKVAGVAYFTASTQGKTVLWKTDGTPAGTAKVADLPGFVISGEPNATLGSRLYFVVSNLNSYGTNAVWVTDGTTSGTHAVYSTNSPSHGPSQVAAFRGKLLVSVDDGGYTGDVYLLDPDSGLATQLTFTGNVRPSFSYLKETSKGAVFPTQTQLWATDGTPTGTVVIATSASFSYEFISQTYALLNDRIFFTKTDNGTGSELWVTDGTLAGTQLFHEFSPAADGHTRIIASTSSLLFVVATGNFLTNYASTLWVTDGTLSGLRKVPLVGTTTIGDQGYLSGVVAGANIFLFSQQTTSGLNAIPLVTRIAPDGSSARRIAEGLWQGDYLPVLDRLFFKKPAPALGFGQEGWVSDGTVAGTHSLGDLGQGPANGSSGPRSFATLGAAKLFAADDGVHGVELWRTDGTSAGTSLVADIAPGSSSSTPMHLTTVGNLVYFYAWTSTEGFELWRTDGTTAGTFALGASNPGVAEQDIACNTLITAFGDGILFPARTGPTDYGLWKSDGTVPGTSRVVDLASLPLAPTSACQLTPLGSKVLLTMASPQYRQLWITDGTQAGTNLVKAINSAGSAFNEPGWLPTRFAVLNGSAYFAAYDGVDGQQLWRTDGTAGGTQQVVSFPSSHGPGQLGDRVTVFKNEVVFFAWNGAWSLYSSDGTAAGTRALKADFSTLNESVVATADTLYFSVSQANPNGTSTTELWTTDGTATGTRQAGKIGAFHRPVLIDGVAFFLSNDEYGLELWMSDGTARGTHRISGTTPDWSDGVIDLTTLAGMPLMTGIDNVHGAELFILHNQPPVAANDAATIKIGSTAQLTVRSNDSDPDGDVALSSVRITAQPAHGTVVEQADGKLLYTPAAGFTGTDTFDYRLTDVSGGVSSAARASVTVEAFPDPPAPPPATPSRSGGGGALGWLELALLLAVIAFRKALTDPALSLKSSKK